MNTQTFKRIAGMVCLVCGLASMSAFAGTIEGSKHDFSTELWNPGGEICVVCHAPHNNSAVVTNAPLWNHAFDDLAAYDPYVGFDMDATAGDPGGVSLLCLSCHDGVLAIDSFGGAVGTNFVPGTANFTQDLSDDHPISITYGLDAELNPEATTFTYADGTGGAITDLLDGASQVQCSSCHDVHNTRTDGVFGNKLLVIDNAASALCLTCHAK